MRKSVHKYYRSTTARQTAVNTIGSNRDLLKVKLYHDEKLELPSYLGIQDHLEFCKLSTIKFNLFSTRGQAKFRSPNINLGYVYSLKSLLSHYIYFWLTAALQIPASDMVVGKEKWCWRKDDWFPQVMQPDCYIHADSWPEMSSEIADSKLPWTSLVTDLEIQTPWKSEQDSVLYQILPTDFSDMFRSLLAPM